MDCAKCHAVQQVGFLGTSDTAKAYLAPSARRE
jgi:hypothetical protein